MRVGVELHELEVVGLLAGERIELGDALDLVAEEAEAPGAVLVMGGEDVDGVALHAEHAAGKVAAGALVLQRHEVGDELALGDGLALRHGEGHRRIGLDRADAVDAGDRGDDDDVVALEQGAGGGVPHAVDLLVDRALLLDIGVGARHVGLGLVVIVVRDEVFHGVVGEEALELAVELRRQRLVGRQDQRRAVGLADDLRHGEGLAAAGDAEQHLVALVGVDALDQLEDGGGLVALGLELGDEVEMDAALGLVGAGRAVRRPGDAGPDVGVAGDEQGLQALRRRRRAGHAIGVRGLGQRRLGRRRRRGHVVAGHLDPGGGAEHLVEPGVDARDRRGLAVVEGGGRLLHAAAAGAGLVAAGIAARGRLGVERRVEQRREVLAQWHDLGLGRLGLAGGARAACGRLGLDGPRWLDGPRALGGPHGVGDGLGGGVARLGGVQLGLRLPGLSRSRHGANMARTPAR